MGDNTEMGTLAVTEELHAKQQEAACKEAERAASAAGRGCGCEGRSRGTSVQKGFGRPEQSSSRSTRNRRPSVPAQAGQPGDGTRWDTGTRCRRPAHQAGAAADRRSRRIRRVAPGRRGDGARREPPVTATKATASKAARGAGAAVSAAGDQVRARRLGRCLRERCGGVPQGAWRNRLHRGPERDGRVPLAGGPIRSPAGGDA